MLNQVDCLRAIFQSQGLIHLAYNVMTYMDTQTLYQVIGEKDQSEQGQSWAKEAEMMQKPNKPQSRMKEMIKSYYFLKEYINKTDRTMYYTFYDQPQFVQIQKQLVKGIVVSECQQQNKQSVYEKLDQFKSILKAITDQAVTSQQQTQQIQRLFVDPSLPLPSIRRETEGIYCNSSFQLFLVSLRFNYKQNEEQQFTLFQQLKQTIILNEDKYLKVFLDIQKTKSSQTQKYKDLHLVRYAPYEVTFANYKSLLIEGHQLHNLIVYIWVLTDVMVQALTLYIQKIDDPFYRFVELMSRYAVYRSFVIQIQEQLGFLFQTYDNLYTDTIKDSILHSQNIKPKYCFWRPAMSKWFVRMNPIHKQTNQIYFMLLTKMREQRIMGQLDTEQQNKHWAIMKKHQICLRNKMDLDNLTSKMKNNIYAHMDRQSNIQKFINYNEQTCQAVVFQYIQYMTDLAINQQTVHWCGHSQHCLGQPFEIFNQEFKSYNRAYFNNLRQYLPALTSQQTMRQMMQLLLQQQVEFLQTKNVKPKMLREIVQEINAKGLNQIMRGYDESEMIEENEKPYKNEQNKECDMINQIDEENNQNNFWADNVLMIIEEDGQKEQIVMTEIQKIIPEEVVFYDCREKDQKLKYFNDKARILESIEGDQKFFFSIPPLLSPEQILIKSIDTSDNSQLEQNDGNSSYQYVSDNEDDFQSQQISRLQESKQKQDFRTRTNSSNPDFLLSSIKYKAQEEVQGQKGVLKAQIKSLEVQSKDQKQLTPVNKLASSCQNQNIL